VSIVSALSISRYMCRVDTTEYIGHGSHSARDIRFIFYFSRSALACSLLFAVRSVLLIMYFSTRQVYCNNKNVPIRVYAQQRPTVTIVTIVSITRLFCCSSANCKLQIGRILVVLLLDYGRL